MDGGKGKEKAGESIADESREALKKTVVELVQEALAEQRKSEAAERHARSRQRHHRY